MPRRGFRSAAIHAWRSIFIGRVTDMQDFADLRYIRAKVRFRKVNKG